MKNKWTFLITIFGVFILILGSLVVVFTKLTDGVDLIVVNGNEKIPSSEWKIVISNVKQETTESASFVQDVIVSDNKLELVYGLVLYGSGDSATITFDVDNKGTIDAKLNKIPKLSLLSEEQEKYLSYSVTYADGTNLHEGDILKSLNKKKIKIHISVKDGVDSSVLNDETINCSFSLNYIQND